VKAPPEIQRELGRINAVGFPRHARCYLIDSRNLALRRCLLGAPERHRSLLALVLRLRPVLIRACLVLPSTPPLFQSVERHFFEGQFGGFSVSGIHLCPQTSQTATLIVSQLTPTFYHILPKGHNTVDISSESPYNMSYGQNMDFGRAVVESRHLRPR
jgi:hypothetical protein